MVKKKSDEPLTLSLNHDHLDRGTKRWPEKTGSVDGVTVINLIQYLTEDQRYHFVNELWRVLKVGAKADISAPHWCSARAYGDIGIKFPPVSEAWPHYLNKEWRTANAPWVKEYKCDFDIGGGYSLHPLIISRNSEYQMNAITFWKEAAQDLLAVLIKR